jgi:hypothetical protein
MHDLGPIRQLLLTTYLNTAPHLLPAQRNRTSIVVSLLNERHGGPQHGPPTSSDFRIQEFYLRGNRTDVVHQQNVETRHALLRTILNAATSVQDNPKGMIRATSSIHGLNWRCGKSASG